LHDPENFGRIDNSKLFFNYTKEFLLKKLKAKGQKWLRGFHALFGCVWLGSAVCLAVIQFFVNPSDGMELYGIMHTIHFIDYFILVPGAIGILLTGLIYSIWKNWGWIKHRWISVKWIICLYGIIFGTYPLGPWKTSLTHISQDKGLNALTDPIFLHNRNMLYVFGTFQTATLIFAVFLAALKPWKKRR